MKDNKRGKKEETGNDGCGTRSKVLKIKGKNVNTIHLESVDEALSVSLGTN